ncbi:MAG: phosphate signaling complex protein PhoU [Phycisphaerales bacterium]
MALDLKNEIVSLRRSLLGMGVATQSRVDQTVEALVDGDVAVAERVKAGDAEIDAMEVDLENQCMRVLALGSPVAHDLRFVLAVVRISADFERIADLSRGIAKKVIRWEQAGHATAMPPSLVDMAYATRTMVHDVLGALASEDPDACRAVRRADHRVDDLNKEVGAAARDAIQADTDMTGRALDWMQVAQRLERIADIATNIAEDVIFLSEGRVVRHDKITRTQE